MKQEDYGNEWIKFWHLLFLIAIVVILVIAGTWKRANADNEYVAIQCDVKNCILCDPPNNEINAQVHDPFKWEKVVRYPQVVTQCLVYGCDCDGYAEPMPLIKNVTFISPATGISPMFIMPDNFEFTNVIEITPTPTQTPYPTPSPQEWYLRTIKETTPVPEWVTQGDIAVKEEQTIFFIEADESIIGKSDQYTEVTFDDSLIDVHKYYVYPEAGNGNLCSVHQLVNNISYEFSLLNTDYETWKHLMPLMEKHLNKLKDIVEGRAIKHINNE